MLISTPIKQPCGYLSNMDPAHGYIPKYNRAQAVFVVGQGAWENECAADLRKLADICWSKGIQIQTDFWGIRHAARLAELGAPDSGIFAANVLMSNPFDIASRKNGV